MKDQPANLGKFLSTNDIPPPEADFPSAPCGAFPLRQVYPGMRHFLMAFLQGARRLWDAPLHSARAGAGATIAVGPDGLIRYIRRACKEPSAEAAIATGPKAVKSPDSVPG